MLILQKEEGRKGKFYIGQDGKILAEILYSISTPGKMVIEHTEVDNALRGKNIGRELVGYAVAYARTNHLKIVPVCPFARSIINKTPEFRDILA